MDSWSDDFLNFLELKWSIYHVGVSTCSGMYVVGHKDETPFLLGITELVNNLLTDSVRNVFFKPI